MTGPYRVFHSLPDLPLDHQFLILAAWQERTKAVIRIKPPRFPISAAVETTHGQVRAGHKVEYFGEPASSHEALADIVAEQIVCAVFIGSGSTLRLAETDVDLLWRMSRGDPDVLLYLTNEKLKPIGAIRLKDFGPGP